MGTSAPSVDSLDISEQYEIILSDIQHEKKTCYKKQLVETRDFLKTLHDSYRQQCVNSARIGSCAIRLINSLHDHIAEKTNFVLNNRCEDKVYNPILMNFLDGLVLPKNSLIDAMAAFGLDTNIENSASDTDEPDLSDEEETIDALDLVAVYKNISEAVVRNLNTHFKTEMVATRDFLQQLHNSYRQQCAKTKSQACIQQLFDSLFQHVKKMAEIVLESNSADVVYSPLLTSILGGLSLPKSSIFNAIIEFGSDHSISKDYKQAQPKSKASNDFDLVSAYKDISTASAGRLKQCAASRLRITMGFLKTMHTQLISNCNKKKANFCAKFILKKIEQHLAASAAEMSNTECKDKVYSPILSRLQIGVTQRETVLLKYIAIFKNTSLDD